MKRYIKDPEQLSRYIQSSKYITDSKEEVDLDDHILVEIELEL